MAADNGAFEAVFSVAPRRWKTVKFGDVASLRYGKPLPESRRKGGPVPVFGSNGIVGYHDEPLISGPGIVIGRKGAAGIATWVDSDFWPIDTTYYVDRTGEVDARWLYYVISMSQLERLKQGPVPGLNRHSVSELKLKVPPLYEQRKIAAILSSVDDAIVKTQAFIDQVQVSKRSLVCVLTRDLPASLAAKTERPDAVPENWKLATLEDVATVVGGGTPSRTQSNYWNGDIPWATPTDVTALHGRVISTTASTITNSGLENSSATLLPPNSLLITTRATIGACAVNTTWMATNQGFQSLVPKDGVCVEFLYYLIQHHTRSLKRLGSGSTYLEIPKKSLSRFQVYLPPLVEQRRIADILSSLDDTIQLSHRTIDQYRNLKRALKSVLLGDVRATPKVV